MKTLKVKGHVNPHSLGRKTTECEQHIRPMYKVNCRHVYMYSCLHVEVIPKVQQKNLGQEKHVKTKEVALIAKLFQCAGNKLNLKVRQKLVC